MKGCEFHQNQQEKSKSKRKKEKEEEKKKKDRPLKPPYKCQMSEITLQECHYGARFTNALTRL